MVRWNKILHFPSKSPTVFISARKIRNKTKTWRALVHSLRGAFAKGSLRTVESASDVRTFSSDKSQQASNPKLGKKKIASIIYIYIYICCINMYIYIYIYVCSTSIPGCDSGLPQHRCETGPEEGQFFVLRCRQRPLGPVSTVKTWATLW